MRATFTVLTALISAYAYAQTIKEFYLPAVGTNKSNLYVPEVNTGRRTAFTSSIWFTAIGDTYEVMEAKFHNGEPTSIETRTIAFTSNEVRLLKTTSTSILQEPTEKIHTPPQTLLKLPSAGQTASWITKNSNISAHKRTAEIISREVRGQMRKVLKVKIEPIENGELLSQYTTFEYYVQGMGLWMVQFHTGEIMNLLVNQEFDPDAQRKDQSEAPAVDSPYLTEIKVNPLEKKADVEENENEIIIFDRVEQQPEFPGGYEAMMQFIKKTLRYPASVRRAGIEGTTYVSFLVAKNGSISEVKTARSLNTDCDKEAMRVVSLMPPWRPGKENGKPVLVRFVLPIKFKL